MTCEFAIEPMGSRDFGPCECCGTNSRSVWGTVSRDGGAEAAYFVHWTLGEARQRGATFRVVLGKWGDRTTRDDRFSVALELRLTDHGPQFMVRDSQPRPGEQDDLAGRYLRRDEVIGMPLAERVFSLVDLVWTRDSRIEELTREGRRPPPDLPIPAPALRDLFERLNEVSGKGYKCDHRFTQTTRFLTERGLPVEETLAWLGENGGGCDCEVNFNTEQRWGEAVGYDPPDEDIPEAYLGPPERSDPPPRKPWWRFW